MFCRFCGSEVKDGEIFCSNCGEKIQRPEVAKPEEETKVAEEVKTEEVKTEEPKKESNSGKKGLIAGICIGSAGLLVGAGALCYAIFGHPGDKPVDNDKVVEESKEKESESTKEPVKGNSEPETSVVESSEVESSEVETTVASSEPEPTPEPVQEEKLAKRTVMIYMVGSNLESPSEKSAGGAGSADLAEMMHANPPANTNIVVECGGAKEWVNPQIPDGEVTRLVIKDKKLEIVENLGKTTMTKKGNLSDFIQFASENYPAEHYTLILWNHGGGVPAGFGLDELGNINDPMSDYEINIELKTADVKFDAIIFDACNMCTLEVGRSIQDYADYMVGAESWVNGVGINYNRWLNYIDQDDPRGFCEIIVQDYMATIHLGDMVGSMSVIRIDMLNDVYAAYVKYIDSLYKNVIKQGDFEAYLKARGNCGYYVTNDSVDLITLASIYETASSPQLINSVVNSVVYTQSDLPYGHGLMAYCPYQSYDLYTQGRKSFTNLGYDEKVVKFYDELMSQRLAYMGEEYIDAYGGNWYVSSYDVAQDEWVDEDYVAELPIIETEDYYAVELSDEDWEIIDYISQTFILENLGYTLVIGEDYQYEVDSDGLLALVYPESWIFINDRVAGYYCVDNYSDPSSDAWSQTGICPVLINDYEAFLYIYFDNEYPSGTILGYYFCDFEDGTYDDTTIYTLEDTDVVDVVYECIDDDGFFYEAAGTPCEYQDMKFEYLNLSLTSGTTYGCYTITDVYGNVYETEIVELGLRENLK